MSAKSAAARKYDKSGREAPTEEFFTSGSTATPALRYGTRKAWKRIYSTVEDEIDEAALEIHVVQRRNPTRGRIKRTGVHVNAYTMPDNGGDDSGVLVLQTGGGNGLTVHKITELRPDGFENYADSPQVALEVATTGGSAALLAVAGVYGGNGHADAMVARQDNPVSEAAALRLEPGNGVFDERYAWAVSGRGFIGGPLYAVQAALRFNGDALLRSLILRGGLSVPVAAPSKEYTVGPQDVVVLSSATVVRLPADRNRLLYVKNIGKAPCKVYGAVKETIDGKAGPLQLAVRQCVTLVGVAGGWETL